MLCSFNAYLSLFCCLKNCMFYCLSCISVGSDPKHFTTQVNAESKWAERTSCSCDFPPQRRIRVDRTMLLSALPAAPDYRRHLDPHRQGWIVIRWGDEYAWASGWFLNSEFWKRGQGVSGKQRSAHCSLCAWTYMLFTYRSMPNRTVSASIGLTAEMHPKIHLTQLGLPPAFKWKLTGALFFLALIPSVILHVLKCWEAVLLVALPQIPSGKQTK